MKWKENPHVLYLYKQSIDSGGNTAPRVPGQMDRFSFYLVLQHQNSWTKLQSALILPAQYIPEASRNIEGVSILGMLFTMECFCKLFSYSQLKFQQRRISWLFVFVVETEIMAKRNLVKNC